MPKNLTHYIHAETVPTQKEWDQHGCSYLYTFQFGLSQSQVQEGNPINFHMQLILAWGTSECIRNDLPKNYCRFKSPAYREKKQTNNNHLSPSFVVCFLPVLKILPFTEGCPACQYTSRWFRSSHPEITLNPQRWGRLCGEQEDDWDGNVCCHTLLIGDFRERSHRNFQLNCEIAEGKWMRISI